MALRLFLKTRVPELNPTAEDLRKRVTQGQQVLGNVILRDSQRYVPLRDGPLRGKAKVENRGKQVVWEAYSPTGYPYSVKQFYTQYRNYTTPGTGPRWDLKAEGLHKSAWVQEVGRAML